MMLIDADPIGRLMDVCAKRDSAESRKLAIELRHAIEEGRQNVVLRERGALPSPVHLQTLEEQERELIKITLEHYGGNQRQAAIALGLNPRVMHYKVHGYGLA